MSTRIFEIHAVDAAEPADVATLRRERDEAVQAVHEWRDAGASCQAELNATTEELASARAENERLHNRVSALCDTDRNAARLVAMIAERDRLAGELEKRGAEWHSEKCLRERAETDAQTVRATLDLIGADLDATRKALATQVEKTNECTRALNAYPGVAELSALRARVAEVEAERDEARSPFSGLFKDISHLRKMEHGLRVQVAELETTLAARTKRVECLSDAIGKIQSLADSV